MLLKQRGVGMDEPIPEDINEFFLSIGVEEHTPFVQFTDEQVQALKQYLRENLKDRYI